jgi:hypothetical protein
MREDRGEGFGWGTGILEGDEVGGNEQLVE